MADIVTPEVRSRMMRGIRGKDTKPEVLLRKLLFASGFRFRLHRKDLPGKPEGIIPLTHVYALPILALKRERWLTISIKPDVAKW